MLLLGWNVVHKCNFCFKWCLTGYCGRSWREGNSWREREACMYHKLIAIVWSWCFPSVCFVFHQYFKHHKYLKVNYLHFKVDGYVFCLNLWKLGGPRTCGQSWHHWTKGNSLPTHPQPHTWMLTYTTKIIWLFYTNDSVSSGHYWRSGVNRQRWWPGNRGIVYCWHWYLNDELWKQSTCISKCHRFYTGLSRTTRPQWKTRTKWSKGKWLILFGFVNKCTIVLFLEDLFVAVCVFYRERKAPWGQQEKWVPKAKL